MILYRRPVPTLLFLEQCSVLKDMWTLNPVSSPGLAKFVFVHHNKSGPNRIHQHYWNWFHTRIRQGEEVVAFPLTFPSFSGTSGQILTSSLRSMFICGRVAKFVSTYPGELRDLTWSGD